MMYQKILFVFSIIIAFNLQLFSQVRFVHERTVPNELIELLYEYESSDIQQQAIVVDAIKDRIVDYLENKNWNNFLCANNELLRCIYGSINNTDSVLHIYKENVLSKYLVNADTINSEYAYSLYLQSDYIGKTDFDSSISYLLNASEILEQTNPESKFYYNTIAKTASFYVQKRNLEKGMYYFQILNKATEIDFETELQKINVIYGLTYGTNPESSAIILKSAVAKIESLNKPEGNKLKGRFYSNIAGCHHYMREFEESISYKKMALNEFEKNNSSPRLLILVHGDLGLIYPYIGKFDKAKYHLEKADSISAANEGLLQGKNLEFWGALMKKQHLYDSALYYFNKIIELELYKGDLYHNANLYLSIAEGYYFLDKLQEAKDNTLKSLWYYNNKYPPQNYSDSLPPIAKQFSNNFLFALKYLLYFEQELYEQTNDSLRLGNMVDYVSYMDLAHNIHLQLSIDPGSIYGKTISLLESYHAGIESAFLMNSYLSDTKYLYEAISFTDRLKSNFLLYQKLSANLNSINDGELGKQLRLSEQELVETKNEEEAALLQVEISRLKSEISGNKLMQLDNGAFLEALNQIKVISDSTLEIIPENYSVLEYYIIDSSLYTFHLTKHNIEAYTVPLPENFNAVLKSMQRELKTSASISVHNNKILYEILIEPVREKLNKNILIIPDESFSFLPFEIFKANGEYIIREYTIQYHYSFNLWRQSIQDSCSRKEINICTIAPEFIEKGNVNEFADYSSYMSDSMGDVFRDGHLVKLIYAIEESKAIEEIGKQNNVNVFTLSHHKVTQKEVQETIPDFSILHFATHGISLKDNPELSGIFLSNNSDNDFDNFISLNELYDLNIKADLVVLSACKSGYGSYMKGEGVIALPRGFIYAGVPNVIASLWKVHDEKTKDLMVAFYKHLLEDKVSYAEALRLAKLDCIAKGFLPIDWAGFVLIGN